MMLHSAWGGTHSGTKGAFYGSLLGNGVAWRIKLVHVFIEVLPGLVFFPYFLKILFLEGIDQGVERTLIDALTVFQEMVKVFILDTHHAPVQAVVGLHAMNHLARPDDKDIGIDVEQFLQRQDIAVFAVGL